MKYDGAGELTLGGGAVGVTANSVNTGINATATDAASIGGYFTGGSRAVYGEALSASGRAIEGKAAGTNSFGGSFYGAYTGVFGHATGATGTAYGGQFQVDSPNGVGVYIDLDSNATSRGLVVTRLVSGSGDLAQFNGIGHARVDANAFFAAPASGYYNFGATTGSSGYGVRDNGGVGRIPKTHPARGLLFRAHRLQVVPQTPRRRAVLGWDKARRRCFKISFGTTTSRLLRSAQLRRPLTSFSTALAPSPATPLKTDFKINNTETGGREYWFISGGTAANGSTYADGKLAFGIRPRAKSVGP